MLESVIPGEVPGLCSQMAQCLMTLTTAAFAFHLSYDVRGVVILFTLE